MRSILPLLLVIYLGSPVFCDRNHTDGHCKLSVPITNSNINKVTNCTFLEGKIYITNATFINLKPEALYLLKTIRKMKGILLIQGHHRSFTNLSFLEKLEEIGSETGKTNEHCVLIENTSLESIELPAIKSIRCIINIKNNTELCYSNQWIETNNINKGFELKAIIQGNKATSECPCHDQCGDGGCFGPDNNHCKNCQNEMIETPSGFTCIEDCSIETETCEKLCRSCDGPCAKLCFSNFRKINEYVYKESSPCPYTSLTMLDFVVLSISNTLMIIINKILVYLYRKQKKTTTPEDRKLLTDEKS